MARRDIRGMSAFSIEETWPLPNSWSTKKQLIASRMPLRAAVIALDCPNNVCCSDSACLRGKNSRGKTAPQTGRSSNRKSDSDAAPAAKRRAAHQGIPDPG